MPRTLYLHANGRKIAQVKDGVRTDYLTDALGSITATKNQSQQIVNTYRWKPYGGQLAKTGTGEDPKYGWTGDTGSRIVNHRSRGKCQRYANMWPEAEYTVIYRYQCYECPIPKRECPTPGLDRFQDGTGIPGAGNSTGAGKREH